MHRGVVDALHVELLYLNPLSRQGRGDSRQGNFNGPSSPQLSPTKGGVLAAGKGKESLRLFNRLSSGRRRHPAEGSRVTATPTPGQGFTGSRFVNPAGRPKRRDLSIPGLIVAATGWRGRSGAQPACLPYAISRRRTARQGVSKPPCRQPTPAIAFPSWPVHRPRAGLRYSCQGGACSATP